MTDDIQVKVKTSLTLNLQVTIPPGIIIVDHAGDEYTIRKFTIGLRYVGAQYIFWGFQGSPRKGWGSTDWARRADKLDIRVTDQPAFWFALPESVRRAISDAHDWVPRAIPPLLIEPITYNQSLLTQGQPTADPIFRTAVEV